MSNMGMNASWYSWNEFVRSSCASLVLFLSGLDTYSALGELTGTLILGVLDQFHDAALIGGEASNLTDDGTNKGDALASLSRTNGMVHTEG